MARKKGRTPQFQNNVFRIDRTELSNAIDDFVKNGGEIIKLQPAGEYDGDPGFCSEKYYGTSIFNWG